MPFVFGDENATIILISALCAGLMTGCATTSKLIPLWAQKPQCNKYLKRNPRL